MSRKGRIRADLIIREDYKKVFDIKDGDINSILNTLNEKFGYGRKRKR